jgi:hypothetical protein
MAHHKLIFLTIAKTWLGIVNQLLNVTNSQLITTLVTVTFLTEPYLRLLDEVA